MCCFEKAAKELNALKISDLNNSCRFINNRSALYENNGPGTRRRNLVIGLKPLCIPLTFSLTHQICIDGNLFSCLH
jgi:hypothetical protein